MAVDQRERRRVPETSAVPELQEPKHSPWALFWASCGVLSTCVVVQGWTRWILSGPERTPNGPDKIATWNIVLLHVMEALSVSLALYMIWRYLVKPLWRERNLTFDGMLVIGGLLMYFYDPSDNYFHFTYWYNTNLVQFGSWANFIPGFMMPNAANFPEPLLFLGGAYLWYVLGVAILGCWILRRAQARWPRMNKLGLLLVLFTVTTILDWAFELFLAGIQLWGFAASPHQLTFFPGKYYQMPWHEGIAVGIFMCMIAPLRYWKDDKGLSWFERGVDSLRTSNRKKKVVRLFAVTGGLHVILLFGFFLPYHIGAMHADTIPALPSYLRAGLCGEGTRYACTSEYVPTPHGPSVPIGPDDPRLPEHVRSRQGMNGQRLKFP